MGWVPHSRRDMYGVGNELEVDPIRAFEGNAVSMLDEGHGKLQGPKPSFLTNQHHNQYWSMDMSFYTYGNKSASYKLPWLNSGCDALVRRKIGSHSDMHATHVSREGLVSQHDGDDGDVRLSPVTSVEVIKAFLQGSGIEYVQTSGPGLALSRFLEMMGGFHSCEVFQNEAIRQTLKDMATGDPRTVHSVEINLIQTLKSYKVYDRPASQAEKGRRAAQLLNRAIEAKLFKVGLVFQCTRCHRRNWYATTDFTDKYNCKSCFAAEDTPHIHEHE